MSTILSGGDKEDSQDEINNLAELFGRVDLGTPTKLSREFLETCSYDRLVQASLKTSQLIRQTYCNKSFEKLLQSKIKEVDKVLYKVKAVKLHLDATSAKREKKIEQHSRVFHSNAVEMMEKSKLEAELKCRDENQNSIHRVTSEDVLALLDKFKSVKEEHEELKSELNKISLNGALEPDLNKVREKLNARKSYLNELIVKTNESVGEGGKFGLSSMCLSSFSDGSVFYDA